MVVKQEKLIMQVDDYRQQGEKKKLDKRLQRAELVTRQEIIRETKKRKKQTSVLRSGAGKLAGRWCHGP